MPLTPEQIAAHPHLKKLAETNARYQRLWGLPVTASEKVARPRPFRTPLPCIHLGSVVGEQVCKSCSGSVRLKEFDCPLHGLTTLNGCKSCLDKAWLPESSKIVRNLLYHIYPVTGNGMWQWNIEQLKKRLHLFNGKKVVAILKDPPSGPRETTPMPHGPDPHRVPLIADLPELVMQALEGTGCEFIVLDNDPDLREVVSFEPLFRSVESRDPAQVTLYAHSKGVTRRSRHQVIKIWTQLLYEIYFDHWPEVERQLRLFPVTGAFKKVGRGWPAAQSLSDYHFSGSWAWIRNRDVFSLPDWSTIDSYWSGIEPWPSLHFAPEEAGCLFFEGDISMNLYDKNFVERVVVPHYRRWKPGH